MTASSRSPGSPDPELTPEGAREAQERKIWEDDDIPLGRLRKGRRPDLRLAATHYEREEVSESSAEGKTAPTSGSSGHSLDVLPLPLAVSPFVPTTANDAGEDQGEAEEHNDDELRGPFKKEEMEEAADDPDKEHLLGFAKQAKTVESRKSLFAKNSSGGHRWCSKCDAWKPDRCHHCRFCKQCTLKSK